MIDGTERGTDVRTNALRWSTEKNTSGDGLSCTLFQGKAPAYGQQVQFFVNGAIVFSGTVLRVSSRHMADFRIEHAVECIGGGQHYDAGAPIAEVLRNMTVLEILEFLRDTYTHLSSLDLSGVDCPETISYLFLDHRRFSEVLSMIAERVGYTYFWDTEGKLHFFLPGAKDAPTEVTDNNGVPLRNSLQFREDGLRLSNMIIVEGDTYDGSELMSEDFTGDDTTTEFSLVRLYSGVSVEIDGVAKTTGSYGVHDATEYDALYDFSGHKLIFAVPPANGAAVTVRGHEKLPILVQVQDESSIDRSGIFAKKIKNTSLKTEDSAVQYALSELSRSIAAAESASFSTHRTDIRAGQRISLSSDIFGRAGSFEVQKTTGTFQGANQWSVSVSLAHAEQVDAVGVLARMLSALNTSTDANQVLKILRMALERVGVADEVLPTDQADVYPDERSAIAEAQHVGSGDDARFLLANYQPDGIDTNDVVLRLSGGGTRVFLPTIHLSGMWQSADITAEGDHNFALASTAAQLHRTFAVQAGTRYRLAWRVADPSGCAPRIALRMEGAADWLLSPTSLAFATRAEEVESVFLTEHPDTTEDRTEYTIVSMEFLAPEDGNVELFAIYDCATAGNLMMRELSLSEVFEKRGRVA